MPRIDIFLKEALAFDAVGMAIENQRPIPEIRKDNIGDTIIISNDIALRVTLFGPKHLVKMGQDNFGHGLAASTALSPEFSLSLPHDIFCRLVASHADKRRMAHMSILGPLGELHFADQFRFHPRGRALVRYGLPE